MLNIDRDSTLPIYKQIEQEIRAAVESGLYRHGEKLPTEAALAKELDISIGTVKKAYAELAHTGLLTKRRGSGVYIKAKAEEDNLPEEPRTVIDEMFEELIKSPVSVRELYELAKQKNRQLFKKEGRIRAALVDCNYETLNGVIPIMEKLPGLDIEPHLAEELLKGLDVSVNCDLILTTQHHYAQLFPYADSHFIRMEQFVLRESRDMIVNLTILQDNTPVAVLFRSLEFLESVRYTLDILRKNVQLVCIHEDMIGEDAEQYCQNGYTFILPPDYKENCSAKLLGLVSKASHAGCRLIPFQFEVDVGSLIHLEQTIRQLALEKGMIKP